MVAFVLRDVLTTGDLPGLESRIFYSSEVDTRSVLRGGQLPLWKNPFYFSGTPHFIEQDRPDGKVVVTVDAPVAGEVYLNEPHFSERRAYVDGEPVDARQTNIAFTAVPVQAGRHRVELRFVPTTFYAGGAMSGLTLVVSLVTGWRVSRTIDARASS